MPATEHGSTRALPLALVIAAAVLLVVRVVLGVWEERHPADRADAVNWRLPDAGESEAKQKSSLLLYFFSSPSEPQCRAITNDVFADERIAHTIEQQYVPVKVVDLRKDAGRNFEGVDALEQRFGVRTFPTLVAFDPRSGHFERLEGYRNATATTRWLATAPAQTMGGLPRRMIGGLIGAGDSSAVDSVIRLEDEPAPPAPRKK